MSLMSVCWTLFKSANIWVFLDLDYILQKRYLLFKSLNNYRYLGVEDLPQEFFIENLSINVEFIDNRTGKLLLWHILCLLLKLCVIVNR